MTEIVFREALKSEKEIVQEYIRGNFGISALSVLKQKRIWIKEGIIKEVFLIAEKLHKILESIQVAIYSSGTPIGSLWKNGFQLEIEGSSLLIPYTKKIIKVKTNQFLYGKPIFKENIETIMSNFSKGDILLVLGENGLHFGHGKALIDSKEIKESKPNTMIVKGYKNKPLDRGWYLRKGN
jgi:ribosome biogenesis protein Nip4